MNLWSSGLQEWQSFFVVKLDITLLLSVGFIPHEV